MSGYAFGTCFLLALVGGPAYSQTFLQTSGTHSWNLNANWDTNLFPNAVGATATFNSPTATQQVQLNQAITVGSITVTNNAASSVLTISNGTGGGPLTFDATGSGPAEFNISGTNSATNNVAISAAVVLADDLKVTNNNVAGTGAATATFTGAMTGPGGLIKDGPGRLSLSTATKAYTGATIINQGRLRFTNSGRLTGTSSITVNSGGSLHLDTSATAWEFGSVPATTLITINGDGDNGGGSGTQGAIRSNASGVNSLTNPVALGSNATIHVEGGTSSFQLNGSVSGSATLTKSGGGNLILAATNSGFSASTIITNGTVTVNASSQLGTGNLTLNQSTVANASLVLNNASQTVGSLSSVFTNVTGTQSHAITLNGTALTVNQSTNTTYGTGAVSTLTSTIGGTGSLTLGSSSAGTLTLSGDNTYTGGTFINGGTLLVANGATGSATGGGAVNVNSGGTLGGNNVAAIGEVTVASGGTIAPGLGGTSTGILVVGNNVTLQAGAAFQAQINGESAGTLFDQLLMTAGNLSVNGTLDITFGSFTPTGVSLKLIDNMGTGSYSGEFTNLANGATIPGTDWKIYYGASADAFGGTNGNDVVLAPVPEPAHLLLVGLAVTAAAGFVRRVRRRRNDVATAAV